MSASRFIRHFKAATGVTPGAYRLNLRLNGARHLLAQGAALAQAAHAMGFADQAHGQNLRYRQLYTDNDSWKQDTDFSRCRDL